MKTILFILTVITCSSVPSFADSYCRGYDSVTGVMVTGTCRMGMFQAYDPYSGAWLNGSCRDGGSFMVYNSVNRSWVNGWCN